MKTFTRKLLLIGVICASIISINAQKTIVPEFTQWNEGVINIRFHEKFGITMDGQARFVNAFNGMLYQVRIAPEIFVDKKLSIIPIGYSYIWNMPYEINPKPYMNNEHRIYSQINFKHRTGRVHFQQRMRYEWRFVESHSADTSGGYIDDGYINFRNRLRYRFLVHIPLNKKVMESKTWYLRLWDEVFLSYADTRLNPTYSISGNFQNRVFLGAGYQATKAFSFSFGVIYQYQQKSNGNYIEHNVGPFISLYYDPDLTGLFKKKEKKN